MVTRYDKGLILILAAFIVVTFFAQFYIAKTLGTEANSEITVKTGRLEQGYYSTEQEKKVELEGKEGPFIFEINNGKVRMVDSRCPHKVCIAQGWISGPDEVIVCAPNRVVISFKGEKGAEVDAVSR